MNETGSLLPIVILGLLFFLVWLRWFLGSAYFKGKVGEQKIKAASQLFLDDNIYRVINDVTLPTRQGTTQIDHIIVSPFGVFVIETKNMTGWIFGNYNQPNWTQVIYGNKQSFRNPLWQNYGHVEAVRELLRLEPHHVRNVVVFVGSCEFKTEMPNEVVKGVFALSRYIKTFRMPALSEEKLPSMVEKILDARLDPGATTNAIHVENQRVAAANRELKAGRCPKCGGEMIKRANKGTGETFLGCKRFPSCRGTRSIQ